MAVLYETKKTRERNIIHHVCANEYTMTTIGEHTITNLDTISCINFSSKHPMVLWSAGRSYLRPMLMQNVIHPNAKIGHGTSLYSIDLRTNTGTFQWSPSHEEFFSEGIHSISGIVTDWMKDHCVWVSSISAGKTYELDMRMPCQVVTSWTLPFSACDECGPNLPATGLYGAGTMFTQPHQQQHNNSPSAPMVAKTTMLSLGKSPDTYGIHMYHRPLEQPRFQARNVECLASAGLGRTFGPNRHHFIRSSIFVLPDTAEDVFSCGLAAIRVPSNTVFHDPTKIGYERHELNGIMVVLSMTNKGDLYTHTLAETTSSEIKSQSFEGLPIGCSAVPIPEIPKMHPLPCSNALDITLSNKFPQPSRAIHESQVQTHIKMTKARYLPLVDENTGKNDDQHHNHEGTTSGLPPGEQESKRESMVSISRETVPEAIVQIRKKKKHPHNTNAATQIPIQLRRSFVPDLTKAITSSKDCYLPLRQLTKEERKKKETMMYRSDLTPFGIRDTWKESDLKSSSSESETEEYYI